MRYHYSSIIIAILGLVLANYIGGLQALYITALLAILEISLSFDNAVVNAKILKTMEPKWQKRFILFGVPIAVFGMRFIFPILIVSIASGMGFGDTLTLAMDNPEKYHHTLESVENLIYAFGGAFLIMVFLAFLFDNAREEMWIKILEGHKAIERAGQVKGIEIMLAAILGAIIISSTGSSSIAYAYFSGVLLYVAISTLDGILSTNGVRNGLVGLLYLEVLDASFSFDGVIGAFALSSDIFIIMIGLGIGAMFVRSMTIHMVEKDTLANYRYLEHGAHYAVFALSAIMLVQIFIPISELIVGTMGVTIIAVSVLHSVKANERETKNKISEETNGK